MADEYGTPTMQGGNMMGQEVPMTDDLPPQMQQMQTADMGMPAAPEPDPERLALDRLLETTNIAEKLDKELLDKIGVQVFEGYTRDCQSKSDWDRNVDEWIKLASQVKEERSWPWPKAANVKYPLLSTASMQFAARAYPALVPADGKIVQMKVVGQDPQGMKADRADRLAKHMNYQLLVDMSDWEEDTDKLLLMLPIVGCLFRKTYFDEIRRKNCSKLLGPKDLVVNYWASSLESAYRVTEVIPMTKNQVKALQSAEIYCDDVELPEVRNVPPLPESANVQGTFPPSQADGGTPYVILEQHTYWDLDEDGYEEPYIITIEEQSRKVLRIVARWDSDGIHLNDDGDLICIDPVEYYTKYGFLPNPDGGFYDIGFGHLLGPLNESANTIVNQLLDAGTLSNLQSGFIGKGLRMKMGELRFSPGEWKPVNATGDDIKKQIFPLPVKEPSEVLFKLLGLIIESSDKLASVAEIFVGKMPGQNTPATTTMATIEQGMKVFTAIYKRVYRAMNKEFKKLFRLNGLYQENIDKAIHVLDQQIDIMDYDARSYDVCPTADPTAVSSTQKLLKAQGLMELLPLGTINVMEVTKRILEAQEQPNIDALMQQQQPKPDPKMEAVKAKAAVDQQKAQLDERADMRKAAIEKEKHQMEMARAQFDAAMDQKQQLFQQKLDEMDRLMGQKLKMMEELLKNKHAEDEHRQAMMQGDEEHQQNLKKIEEESAAKQRATARMAKSSGNKGAKN